MKIDEQYGVNQTAEQDFFSRFVELFGEAMKVTADLKELSAEAKEAGLEPGTMKRLAKLQATEKLNDHIRKERALVEMATRIGGQLSLALGDGAEN